MSITLVKPRSPFISNIKIAINNGQIPPWALLADQIISMDSIDDIIKNLKFIVTQGFFNGQDLYHNHEFESGGSKATAPNVATPGIKKRKPKGHERRRTTETLSNKELGQYGIAQTYQPTDKLQFYTKILESLKNINDQFHLLEFIAEHELGVNDLACRCRKIRSFSSDQIHENFLTGIDLLLKDAILQFPEWKNYKKLFLRTMVKGNAHIPQNPLSEASILGLIILRQSTCAKNKPQRLSDNELGSLTHLSLTQFKENYNEDPEMDEAHQRNWAIYFMKDYLHPLVNNHIHNSNGGITQFEFTSSAFTQNFTKILQRITKDLDSKNLQWAQDYAELCITIIFDQQDITQISMRDLTHWYQCLAPKNCQNLNQMISQAIDQRTERTGKPQNQISLVQGDFQNVTKTPCNILRENFRPIFQDYGFPNKDTTLSYLSRLKNCKS